MSGSGCAAQRPHDMVQPSLVRITSKRVQTDLVGDAIHLQAIETCATRVVHGWMAASVQIDVDFDSSFVRT